MTPDEKRSFALSHPVHIGVDTGKKFHVLVARGPDGRRTKPFKVYATHEGFLAARRFLEETFPGIRAPQMLVGIEFAGHHGFTFANWLAQWGYPIVTVMPMVTKRSKELEDNSPLKTDAKDAATICRLTGEGLFVRFPFLKSPYVELRLLTTYRHRLSVEIVRYKNRLQGVLDLAWPEFVEQFSGLHKKTPRAILTQWPLPDDFLGAPKRQVQKFILEASRGHVDLDRIRVLRNRADFSIALKDASRERRVEILHLLERWRLAESQLELLEERIGELVEQCPEAKRLLSVPEVSAVCAATIVSELGTPADYQHPRQILKLAGMNLVGSSSGAKNEQRAMKWQSKRGRPALRRQLYLLAGRWCQKRGLLREEYLALRARNGDLGTKAVASIARKIVPVLFRVMQSGEYFDEARWQADRRQKASN
jgi:transposase